MDSQNICSHEKQLGYWKSAHPEGLF